MPANRADPAQFARHHDGCVDNPCAVRLMTGPVQVLSMLVAPEGPLFARLTSREAGIVVDIYADGYEQPLGSVLAGRPLWLVAERVFDVLRQVQ